MGSDWSAFWRRLRQFLTAVPAQPHPAEAPPGPDEIVEAIIVFGRAGELSPGPGLSARGQQQARDMAVAARRLIADSLGILEDQASPLWVWTQGDNLRHRSTATNIANVLGTAPHFLQDTGVGVVQLTAPFDAQCGPRLASEVNYLAMRVLTDRPAGVIIVAELPIISGIFAADPLSQSGRTIKEASLHALRVTFARNRVLRFEFLPDTNP